LISFAWLPAMFVYTGDSVPPLPFPLGLFWFVINAFRTCAAVRLSDTVVVFLCIAW